ncbi:MAG TPA: C39 family peptidase [Holophagaceae bacterium]|nr:C39 family peptidase [Holophagaceae bacterium]
MMPLAFLLALPVLQAGAAPRLPAGALPVPLFRQSTGYACGASALQAVLYYWRVYDGQESKLYPTLGTTPEWGTPPEGLVAGARAFGLEARLQEGTELKDLRAALAAGETVILNLQAWRDAPARGPWKEAWEDGHYVVLVGLDDTHLYAMDPSVGAGYAYLPIAEFLERWHDYTQAGGRRREYRHLAVFIKGKTPLPALPAPPTRMQ